MSLLVIAAVCHLVGCAQAARTPKRAKPSAETSATAGSLTVTLKVAPVRAAPRQRFSARLTLANTSKKTIFLPNAVFVQVRSQSDEIVFNSRKGFGRESIEDMLDVEPGRLARKAIHFSLTRPGKYVVQAYVDRAPPIVTPPIGVTVVE